MPGSNELDRANSHILYSRSSDNSSSSSDSEQEGPSEKQIQRNLESYDYREYNPDQIRQQVHELQKVVPPKQEKSGNPIDINELQQLVREGQNLCEDFKW